ncbi:chromosome segregation protein SMC [Furfurilactobacillus siliginis]|uniref:Chromosome partition protein Smc n=1 Tax=Furfurilactobacillus siliginis TaxID=348151 RepID=A0A0R2L564_9LACO|nr:chromosome segregation protein SMC [Furfurilactobacillus siliginis]KRN96905.1 chromosome segregation protein [Furfurilactobacillus siliginis]GEK28101.1 chromosome partition protein Smc [Furfurilactobacillus siliginis]
MKLKTLEISGFKSFADKTKIEFMSGLTGIVGPNGSGKSNIIEAIRWVLGEQSAKDLRGTKMTDVIFAGSANRKPLNRAEVSITFDNADHYLKSDFSEVKVTRRLFRNGESGYLVNGQDCRLRDILELFMDTGLGRESFSIISQGRVEAIFNSKPEDRRSIIEEVAGVYKYKQNKDKAQKELGNTREYLNRVNDIIAELEGQMEPLAEQSALAKDYVDQKERYDQLEQARLVIEITDNQAAKQVTDKKIADSKALVTRYETDVAEQTQHVTQLKARREALTVQKDDLQAQLLKLTEETTALSGKQETDATRSAFQKQQQTELTARLETVNQTLESSQAALAAALAAQSKQQQAVDDATAVVAGLTSGNSKAQQQRLNQQLQQLQDDYVDQMQALTTLHNEQHFLAQTHERDDQQQARVGGQLTKLLADVETVTQKRDAAQAVLDEQLAKQQTCHAQFEAAGDDYHKLTAAFETAQKNWYNALTVMQRAKARADSLAATNDEHASFYQGVRAILKVRSQFPGVVGPVADLVTVPADLTKAIETALGAQLQQLVVTDENTARDAVQYLTKNRAGRATFLPQTTIHGHRLSDMQIKPLQGQPGFVGVASDLVSFKPELQSIVDHLLGTTVIATTLDAALQLAKIGGHRFRIVTQDGQIMNASGSITGGANKHTTAGVLSQRAELTKLTQDISTMQTALSDQEKQVSHLQEQVDTAAASGAKLRDQKDQIDATVQSARGQLTLVVEQLTVATRRMQAIKLEQQQGVQDDADYQTQIETTAKQVIETEAALTQIKEKRSALQADLNSLTADMTTQTELLQTKQQWLAGAKASLKAQVSDCQRLQQTVAKTTAEVADLRHQLDTLTNAKKVANEQNLAEQLAKATAATTEVQQQLSQTTKELTGLAQMLADGEAALTRAQELQRVALSDMNALSATQSRLATLLDNDLNVLAEAHHLTLAAAKAQLDDALPIAEIKRQLKLLKRGLDEIGDVNVGAIEEYQRVSERYDFLARQQSDLLTSQEQLQETMSEMDTEVETRFKTAFDEVADAFSEIFGQMFGGGKAQLVLTDPVHLLTTGIDIMAQPPGKKFQRMSLLSGGERALTAITLLFAILAVRPVPFAILDETEAALDEANVARFARYLRDFGGGTQFIVITHRKGTMVNANVLYGVTMQESGVSKMVAVSLDDVEAVS